MIKQSRFRIVQALLILVIGFIPGHSLQAFNPPLRPTAETPPASGPAQPMRLGSALTVTSATNPLTPLAENVGDRPDDQPPYLSSALALQPYVAAEGAAGADLLLRPISASGEGPAAEQGCVDYIRNGGFEANTDWFASSQSNVAYNTQTFHLGARSLFISSQNRVTAYAGQLVQLPAQMSSIFVRFQYAAQLDADESAWVEFWDANTNTRLAYGAIPAAGGQWYDKYYWLDQSVLAGRNVNVYFRVYQDGDNYYSNLWLDDVQLGVCDTPPPTPTDDSRTIDLTISLWRTPDPLQERWKYEEIIAYAADAIYEMSNGKHFLGQVTFYQNGQNSPNAHVLWQQDVWPHATISGYWHPGTGSYLWFGDVGHHENGYSILYNLVDRQRAGYYLAHELGHYYYGMMDEYADPNVSTDVPVPNSVMNAQYLAEDIFPDPDRYKWLNFSTPKSFNYFNRQYRKYRADAWGTLVRPQDFPGTYADGSNQRAYFPELASVAPRQGEWPSLELDKPNAQAAARSRLSLKPPIWVAPTASALAAQAAFQAQITFVSGAALTYPQPAIVEATVTGQNPIARAGLQTQVVSPNGQLSALTLADDGIPPDALADDGRYTALMPYDRNGPYTLTVTFDNASGLATFTDKGLADSPQQLRDLVGTNFSAVASTTLVISGFAADDHGDEFQSSTPLPSQNVTLYGQVDRPGDVDMFKATLLGNGRYVFRIAGFAHGMQPRIRFWDAATGRALGDFSFTPAPGYYYYIIVDGDAGASLYAGVSHGDPNASAGMYQVSFGLPLPGELSGYDIFLPAIRR